MPLDAEIARLLAAQASASPMHTLSVPAMREAMVVSPPERRTAVSEVQDLAIAMDGRALGARLYRPMQAQGSGLVLYFHGGGFVIGSLDTHDHVCRDLCAASGATVLAVDYRLAPEHRFPAAADDALLAARWVATQAGSLGVDAARVVLAGDSAGANLATVAALRLRDEGGLVPRAQVLFYPVTDYHTPATASYLQNASGYGLTRAAMVRFWDEYLADAVQARHPHAAPLRALSLAGLPPALVLTAGFDPLRDEGNAYAHRLLDAGVPVTLWQYDDLVHGFIRMAQASAAAAAALQRAAQWIRQALA